MLLDEFLSMEMPLRPPKNWSPCLGPAWDPPRAIFGLQAVGVPLSSATRFATAEDPGTNPVATLG